MKKVILMATAIIFSVAMYAQTATAPKGVKSVPKTTVAQNTAKPADKTEGQTKGETKKEPKKGHKKGMHHEHAKKGTTKK